MDYPAAIDHVLNQTGHADLFFIGYSMGTTRYCVMLSLMPEYNAKIKAGFLMGPATSMTNANATIFQAADEAENIQDWFHNTFGNVIFLVPSFEAWEAQWHFDNQLGIFRTWAGFFRPPICTTIYKLSTHWAIQFIDCIYSKLSESTE